MSHLQAKCITKRGYYLDVCYSNEAIMKSLDVCQDLYYLDRDVPVLFAYNCHSFCDTMEVAVHIHKLFFTMSCVAD